MNFLYKILPISPTDSKATRYATLFLILFGIYYYPLEPNAGFGVIKVTLLALSILSLFVYNLTVSKALVIGFIYIFYQFIQSTFFPTSFRWSTLLFSAALVLTYVNFYNALYFKRVFTIDHFISLMKWMMMAYFIVCIIQQACIMVGIRNFPLINMLTYYNRGIGCCSLSLEPSSFARTMLVCYYSYIKCCEYKRGMGKFTLKELFSGEYKWVSIRFVWMMTTMGSGTAFVCLILLSLYFIKSNNWFYIIPTILFIYIVILPMFNFEQLNRAVSVGNAMTTLDREQVEEADGSGASRISPIFNSFKADFSKTETWFGYGIDYTRNNELVIKQQATLFDDYGFIFYIIALVLDFTCAYHFFSLSCIFMFAGIAGGAGTNIPYGWELMMIMTCIRYFHDQYTRGKLVIKGEETEEDAEIITEPINMHDVIMH